MFGAAVQLHESVTFLLGQDAVIIFHVFLHRGQSPKCSILPLTILSTPVTVQSMTPKQLLKIYGSQSEIARALGVTRQAVLRWFKEDKIPALRLYQIQCVLKVNE